MKTEWIKTEGNLGEIKVEFEAQEWKKAQDKALKKLAQRVNIPGFRAGKAPLAMVKKQLSTMAILQDAMDAILDANFTKIIMDCPKQVIAQPTLDIDEINEETLKVTFKVEVKPEITLGQYKGFEVTKVVEEVTEEEIENELKRMQEQYAEMTIKEEGTVEEGDTAVIDFEGFVDGVAFEGGKGENHPLEIGSGSFIPGFEEQIIGMKVNEEKEINVTFPADYQAADLAGQEVTFKVVVHEIKAKVLPEIDDELAKDVNIDGVETLDDLQTYTKEQIRIQKQNQAENEFSDKVFKQVIENTPVDVPDVMVENEIDYMLKEIEQNLAQQGLTLELFQQFTGKSEEDMRNEVREQAENRVKFNLILAEIVKVEGIEVTDEEVDEEIKEIASYYGKEVDEIKKIFGGQLDQIKADLSTRKAVQLIKDNVK